MFRFSRSRFLRFLVLGFVGIFCAVTFAACGSGTTGAGGASPGASGTVLKVATEPAFPPFESQSADGKIEGFSIDLLNAVAEAGGFTIEFQSLPFDGIIPALQAGTVDAAISSITITKERAATVAFSRPYFKAGLAIAVAADNSDITDLASLKGKKIAAQIGTTGATKSKEVGATEVRTFDSAPLALQELSNGNVDAVINDAPVTLYAIKSGNIPGVKVVGELVTEEFYGIALPKDSANLEKVNAGLTTIFGNGKYKEVYQKWFGSEPPTLPETAL
jgi:arginine/lysine/histidine/glutamine transport system substrate-binding and permease protein